MNLLIDNYSKPSEGLWNYYLDKIGDANDNVSYSKPFKYETQINRKNRSMTCSTTSLSRRRR